jgi:hypothetical protein
MINNEDNRIEKNDNLVKKLFAINNIFLILLLSLLGLTILSNVYAIPVGPTIIFNSTTNGSPTPAAQITTYGGSFTTLVLNVTGEDYRWKAYIGNVTGKLALDDATGKAIFDWSVASVTGEVYATRNTSIDWSTIACADNTTINNEDIALNMSLSAPDTINKTFVNKVHKSFYVGTTLIQNSTCKAVATYVNGTAQSVTENAVFQEILLKDGTSKLIYSTLINQNTTGYNNQKYDFQLIVAENEYQASPTTYYLYVELV